MCVLLDPGYRACYQLCRIARHSQQNDGAFVLGNEQLLKSGCASELRLPETSRFFVLFFVFWRGKDEKCVLGGFGVKDEAHMGGKIPKCPLETQQETGGRGSLLLSFTLRFCLNPSLL